MSRLRLALAILVLPAGGVCAAGLSASQELEALPKVPTELRVLASHQGPPTAGDVVLLTLDPPMDAAPGAAPAIAEKLKAGPVEWGTGRVLWWRLADPSKNPSEKAGTLLVALTAYAPGKYEISPLVFTKDGKPVFASQPQTVEFSSVGGDKSKDEIYPPAGGSLPKWVWVVAGICSLLTLLAVIWLAAKWWRRKRSRRLELESAPRVLNPIEEFEQKRSDVERRGLVEKQAYKPHYFALSDAAKRFLGRACRFDAEERTTRELMRELEGFGLETSLIDQWESIFNEMDAVKFTDQSPQAVIAKELSQRLANLCQATYPRTPVAREALRQAEPR